MEHPNKAFRSYYAALGRPYQNSVRAKLYGAGFTKVSVKNWLVQRVAVPAYAQPLVCEAMAEAYTHLLRDTGFLTTKKSIYMALFQKGSTTIEAELKKLNLSIVEFADKIGISRQTISSIMKGKQVGYLHTAQKIASFFNLPIEAFKEFN